MPDHPPLSREAVHARNDEILSVLQTYHPRCLESDDQAKAALAALADQAAVILLALAARAVVDRKENPIDAGNATRAEVDALALGIRSRMARVLLHSATKPEPPQKG